MFRSNVLYNSVLQSIQIDPILNVNTSLTKMFYVKHIEYQRGAAKHPSFHPGMESRGNITITHDGHTTSSEILGINPEALRAEFEEFRQQFITERLAEGASMEEADAEAREITPEVVKKAKELRVEKQSKKEKLLDKIEEKLPKEVDNPELRVAMMKEYLNEHGSEIIAEVEQYTLDEIKAETELFGSVKSSRTAEFLRNYAEAEQTSEEFERNAEEGIRKVYTAAAETFNRLMIPGYEAWADGGTTTEVVTSAGSDIVLTLIGGKAIKVACKGTKALYQGAKVLEKSFAAEKKVFEIAINKSPYNPRAIEQLLMRDGAEVTSSTLPKLTQPNVKFAGLCKERTIINPETGETITQRIVFDKKGFPILDDVAKVDIRISGDLSSMNREAHMRAATRQLRTDIAAGKIDPKVFTEIELAHIKAGKEKIGKFTWHHHQETGRMQLVPTDIHQWIKHVGGNELWGKK